MAGIVIVLSRLWELLTRPTVPPADLCDGKTCASSRMGLPNTRVYLYENTLNIHGFPPQPPSSSSPDKCISPVYLRIRYPYRAEAQYILGPSWRSQLIGQPGTGLPQTIPIPDDSLNEANHCLRMRRCGAYLVRQRAELGFLAPPLEPAHRHIMGWPTDGGVWVFRYAPEVQPEYSPEARVAFLPRELYSAENMEDFCEVLKGIGAIYYKDIGNCPEAMDLRLLEPDLRKHITAELSQKFEILPQKEE